MRRSLPMRRTGLLPGPPPTRKTGLKAGKPLARSSVPLARAPLVQKPPRPKLVPKQKSNLVRRSAGFCEIRKPGVCTSRATDVAHRISEGSGGRHGIAAEINDRLSNVLHACRACHDWCHDQPTAAGQMGWMLRNGAHPLFARVWYQDRRWVLLGDDGEVSRCAYS